MELSLVQIVCLWILVSFGSINGVFVIPEFGHARHQFIAGFGIPIHSNAEAVNVGIVLKAQYKLPESPHQLEFSLFPDIFRDYVKDFPLNYKTQKFPSGRRRREIAHDPLSGQTYEVYEEAVEEIGNLPLANDTTLQEIENSLTYEDDEEFDDQFEEDLQEPKRISEDDDEETEDFDFSKSRWVAYDALSSTLESKGFDGRTCVLRGICEAADVQFSEHLMSELFHIFFTPSTTAEPVSKSSDYDYIKAEQIGRDRNAPDCQEIFHQCKRSIMEIFTEVYDNKLFQF